MNEASGKFPVVIGPGDGSTPAAANDARHASGFRIPGSYTALRRMFEVADDTNFADLYYRTFDGLNQNVASLGGENVLNFCSYDYLGMCGDPEIAQAAMAAIATYGTSVSASRLVSGERPIHRQLETALADWMGAEDAITFVSGFSTNADVIGHLMGPDDYIIYDSLIHASVRQGVKLSGATARPFPHGDLDALEKVLQRSRGSARQLLIVVEGIYSMDGDIADLPRLIDIKRKYDALLMVDEAHSMGVLGATGRGISEYHKVDVRDVDLWMGTLSKAFASCGGYIAGSRELVTYLRHTAPSFVYSVGLAPALAAVALKSLRLLQQQPERVERLRQRTRLFHQVAHEHGLDVGASSPDAAVVPIMTGPEQAVAGHLSRYLLKHNVLALPICFPAVARNRARLRFFISNRHGEDEIREAVGAVAKGLAEVRAGGGR
jgi:8-amino-7-oxononanoate synthase